MGVLPLTLEVGFRLQGFDVLNAFDGLHQHRVANGALAHPLLCQLRHRPLHQNAGDDDQRNGDQRDRHQLAPHQRHDAEKQQHKGNVHRGANRGGGEQLTHLVDLTQLRHKGSGGFRAGIVLDRHCPGKKQRRDVQIDVLAHDVRHVGARQANEKLQQRGEHHAEEQHPQRREGLRRYYPVIDLH